MSRHTHGVTSLICENSGVVVVTVVGCSFCGDSDHEIRLGYLHELYQVETSAALTCGHTKSSNS